MASLGKVSIDLNEYMRLPRGTKARFDAWLKAEKLTDKLIVDLSLGEWQVTVERYATNADGEPFLGADGKFVMEVTTYPVNTLPPPDAFGRFAAEGEGA